MAGDWIKVEHATADKPEVALFAELLGVSVAEGLGLLIMFWLWCDKNSCNGCVTHVSRSSIDTVTHTPGFCAALESVGWCQIDEQSRMLTLPNFTRHNESSAKSRALTNKRVKRSRNADTVTESLPEKRREEKNIKSSTKPAPEPSAPTGVRPEVWTEWQKLRGKKLTPYAVALQAKQLTAYGGDPNEIIEQSIRNGWAGLFALKRDGPQGRQSARSAVVAQIFGGNDERHDERVIDGQVERVG